MPLQKEVVLHNTGSRKEEYEMKNLMLVVLLFFAAAATASAMDQQTWETLTIQQKHDWSFAYGKRYAAIHRCQPDKQYPDSLIYAFLASSWGTLDHVISGVAEHCVAVNEAAEKSQQMQKTQPPQAVKQTAALPMPPKEETKKEAPKHTAWPDPQLALKALEWPEAQRWPTEQEQFTEGALNQTVIVKTGVSFGARWGDLPIKGH
ncbi:MAG: hypothetical protein KGH79_00200 [Patescibacteria group bacterium]|nr:hypothetical protein [Patescibacteria group bacterium]